MSIELNESFNWDSVRSQAYPTNPAAGADFTYTVPAGTRVRLDALQVKLVTDATVANRGVQLEIQTSGAIPIFKFPAVVCANQTASKSGLYEFCVGSAVSDVADQLVRTLVLADKLELPANTIIKTTVANLQATDQVAVYWILKRVVL